MNSYGDTNKGLVRELNEDSYFVSQSPVGCLPNLFIIADGMGGHNAGEVASKIAIEEFVKKCKEIESNNIEDLFVKSIEYVNKVIYNKAVLDNNLSGMGTTFVACSIMENEVYIANVGDSRLYVCDRELEQITIDHSLVEELVKAGEITRDESFSHPERNVITRALGTTQQVNVDVFKASLDYISKIMLCSDGLTNMVSDNDIYKTINSNNSLYDKIESLIKQAIQNGGLDNITIILIEIDD
jgi:protein phosphatase